MKHIKKTPMPSNRIAAALRAAREHLRILTPLELRNAAGGDEFTQKKTEVRGGISCQSQ